jgi:hypothetical protein
MKKAGVKTAYRERQGTGLTIMWRRLSYACISIILTILACSRRCFFIA